MIRHLSHRATVNIGDRYTAPALYLPLPGSPRPGPRAVEELQSAALNDGDDVVAGGGGFVRHHALDQVARRARRLVVWGMGDNVHDDKPDPGFAPLPENALVGVRDWPPLIAGNPEPRMVQWAPCASCLHPAFDVYREQKPSVAVVVYQHYEHALPTDTTGLPLTTNGRWRLLKDVLRFLSYGETVVTNSYHGMYWATLLGRRVIAYPLSTRHRRFRYPAPLLEAGDPWRKGVPWTAAYPEALAECRKATRDFGRLVWEFFGIPVPAPVDAFDPDPADVLDPNTRTDRNAEGLIRHRVRS